MFWFCVLLTIVTYPVVCAGSVIGFIILIVLASDHSDMPNPFVTPATVYRFYRSTFSKWSEDLKSWYKKESK